MLKKTLIVKRNLEKINIYDKNPAYGLYYCKTHFSLTKLKKFKNIIYTTFPTQHLTIDEFKKEYGHKYLIIDVDNKKMIVVKPHIEFVFRSSNEYMYFDTMDVLKQYIKDNKLDKETIKFSYGKN